MEREALKLAFEAHRKDERHHTVAETRYWCNQYKLLAHQAIEALAQPAQEPVAWMYQHPNNHRKTCYQTYKPSGECTPLYTTPPQRPWVGLTDEEIQPRLNGLPTQSIAVYARSIEAILKEKNT